MNSRIKKTHVYKCLRCKDRNYLIQCICGYCNEVIFKRNYNCHERKYQIGHRNYGSFGFKNNNYRSGRKIGEEDGYWMVLIPGYYKANKNGYVYEHVYFYEQYHKVCVCKWAVVHHIDHNKENNMPWNLVAMERGEHTRTHISGIQHKKKKTDGRVCSNCGSEKTYMEMSKNGKYYPRWFTYDGYFICYNCYRGVKN